MVHTGARYINSTKDDPQKVLGTLNPPQVHPQAPHKFRFRLYYGGEKRHKKDPLACLFLCVVKKIISATCAHLSLYYVYLLTLTDSL